MKKSIVILSLAAAVVATSVVFYVYNNNLRLMAEVKVKYDREEIKDKAEQLVHDLNIPVNGLKDYARLKSNTALIRQVQEVYGLKKGNELLRKSLPGYYWEISWMNVNNSSLNFGNNSEDKSKDDQTKISVAYDNNGNLIKFNWALSDSTALPSLSLYKARQLVEKFISRFGTIQQMANDTSNADTSRMVKYSFISGSNEIINLKIEKKIDLLHRVDYQYVWTGKSSFINDEINMEVTVSGNIISNFKFHYDVPPKYSEDNSSIYQSSLNIVFYFIIILLMGIIAYKKIKAYEIGFKLSIILTGLVAVTFGLNVYNSIPEPLGWIVLLPVGFSMLFYGGAFFIAWAVSETITREVSKEKFLSLDLLTKGSFNHSKVGRAVYNGFTGGFVLTVIWFIMLFIVQSFTSIWNVSYDTKLLSYLNTSSPALQVLIKNIPSSMLVCVVFFNFTFSGLRKRFNSMPLLIITVGLLWGLMNPNGLHPIYTGILVEIIIGIAIAFIFYKFDILTTLVAVISYNSILKGLDLLTTGHATYLISGYFLIGLLAVILIWATYALLSKDKAIDLEKLTPAFVENITERQRLQRELEIARDVQKSFLPGKDPEFDGIEIISSCLPALEVGGDYYDFVLFDKDRIGVIVGDVSGKGTQAAFYMTLTKGFLKALAKKYDSPSEFLSEMNTLFYENVERGTFISMIYGIFNLKEKSLTLARAGHNPLLVKNSQVGKMEVLNPTGMALGLEKGSVFKQTITEVVMPVESGDVFVFYTDGFTEAMNKKNEEYGEENLIHILEQNGNLSAGEISKRIFAEVRAFMGKAQQHDDMTLVVVKIK